MSDTEIANMYKKLVDLTLIQGELEKRLKSEQEEKIARILIKIDQSITFLKDKLESY